MRRIKLIHILLFSFTVVIVGLLGIILGSWRLVSYESEESVQQRMRNMLGDTVAALEDRLTRLEDGSRLAASFSEIREFLAGDERARFLMKNSVRAELRGLVYYESGAVGAYLHTADGSELSACPEGVSYQSIIPYRVNLLITDDYHPEKPFLQAQINPHALYNNFECIRGMAAQGATGAIREMTTCLARMYRYCCKGETLVRLEEEAECLKYYARVLELRYGGVYRIITDLAPETRDAQIPRMILQPLAENAVQHGMITPGKAEGTVRISASVVHERLILKIADDGAGMDEEALKRYNGGIALHDDGTHSHIGITNVLRRLNMIYRREDREDAGRLAFFENCPGGGLTIAISLPMSAPEMRAAVRT